MHTSHKHRCHIVSSFLYLIIIFRVETIDGSANEGEDYVAINETLTFEPYQKEKEVSTSENDGDADNDEDVRDDNFLAMIMMLMAMMMMMMSTMSMMMMSMSMMMMLMPMMMMSIPRMMRMAMMMTLMAGERDDCGRQPVGAG